MGEQYGPTQHDLNALREWLGSQGLSVKEVAPSGMFVSVSGPASLVGAALGTEFHYFETNGRPRVSATTEPAIPTALVPIVASISGLAEVEIRPAQHGERPEAGTRRMRTVSTRMTRSTDRTSSHRVILRRSLT